ncbi:DUF1572 family protein [Fulvivirga ligni]|uniref:DUF1572 family protein n=1 Tax=Fulvivirga ligni TaxID=2904246 RepID=UPI001F357DC7|nr:DUF1572 family protein [Fulvivirga ligni]UII21697.1 DUF1572 domain-containing protein [Fulvivirga ligni]
MIIETLKTLFSRDIQKLKYEIEQYQNEENLWLTDAQISNCAGNLCLHLLGNLNYYIGNGLAKTGYIRERDLEFSQKNVPRAELLQKIEAVQKVVNQGLDGLSMDDLKSDFPIQIWEKPTEMEYTLVHLLTHLSYHLGQINYHRRLLDS